MRRRKLQKQRELDAIRSGVPLRPTRSGQHIGPLLSAPDHMVNGPSPDATSSSIIRDHLSNSLATESLTHFDTNDIEEKHATGSLSSSPSSPSSASSHPTNKRLITSKTICRGRRLSAVDSNENTDLDDEPFDMPRKSDPTCSQPAQISSVDASFQPHSMTDGDGTQRTKRSRGSSIIKSNFAHLINSTRQQHKRATRSRSESDALHLMKPGYGSSKSSWDGV